MFLLLLLPPFLFTLIFIYIGSRHLQPATIARGFNMAARFPHFLFDQQIEGSDVDGIESSATESSRQMDPELDIVESEDGVGLCCDPQRGAKLLSTTSECWQSGLYSDVTVIVGSNKFRANRIVLAALSDYFRPLFQLDEKDSEVTLHNIEPEEFSVLMRFAYTGQLEMRQESVQTLLIAADYLRVDFVRTAAEKFMAKNIDVENVCSALSFAHSFSLSVLKNEAEEFLKRNLEAVIDSQGYFSLDSEILWTLFSGDDLVLYKSRAVLKAKDREILILQAVLTYLSQNPNLGEDESHRLFETVRLPLVSKDKIENAFKTFKNVFPKEIQTKYMAMRKIAANYMTRLKSEKDVPVSEQVPKSWLRRRKLSAIKVCPSNTRYAAGGQVALFSRPPKAPHKDPNIEISKIDIWIRRWDGRPVIGALAITYRSADPKAKFTRYVRGTHGPTWEHYSVELFPLEFINKVIIGHGFLIDRLGFETTSGRVLGPFGGPGGRESTEHFGQHNDKIHYLADINCDVTRTQGADAILNLVCRWAVMD